MNKYWPLYLIIGFAVACFCLSFCFTTLNRNEFYAFGFKDAFNVLFQTGMLTVLVFVVQRNKWRHEREVELLGKRLDDVERAVSVSFCAWEAYVDCPTSEHEEKVLALMTGLSNSIAHYLSCLEEISKHHHELHTTDITQAYFCYKRALTDTPFGDGRKKTAIRSMLRAGLLAQTSMIKVLVCKRLQVLKLA